MPEPKDNSMQDLKPTVWIGKQGCTETMIGEIIAQLKKRRMIKVKWLQNTDVDPEVVATLAKARLIEIRGRTMVLADMGRATKTPGPAVNVPAKVTAKAAARAPVKSREKSPERVSANDAPNEAKPAKRQIGEMKRAKK